MDGSNEPAEGRLDGRGQRPIPNRPIRSHDDHDRPPGSVIVRAKAADSHPSPQAEQPRDPFQPFVADQGSRKLVWQVRSSEPSSVVLESTADARPLPPVGRRYVIS